MRIEPGISTFSGNFAATVIVEDMSLRFGLSLSLHPSYLGKKVQLTVTTTDSRVAIAALAHALGAVPYYAGPRSVFFAPACGERFPVRISGPVVYFSDGTVDSASRHTVTTFRTRGLVDGYPVMCDFAPVRSSAVISAPQKKSGSGEPSPERGAGAAAPRDQQTVDAR